MLTGGAIRQLWDGTLLSSFMLNVKVALACLLHMSEAAPLPR